LNTIMAMAGAYKGLTFSSVIPSRVEQLQINGAETLQLSPSSFAFLGNLFDEVYTMLRPSEQDYVARQTLITFLRSLQSKKFGEAALAILVPQ